MKYITKNDLALPQRQKSSHKGENGRVLVIGGSKDYIGAPALAGIAALRSGADIVVVAAPQKVAWAINCLTPDLITKKFPCDHFTASHAKAILELSKKFDCILIGNGIGKQSAEFVRTVAYHANKPLVIDAEAIHAVSLQKLKNSIITPHSRELEILLSNSNITKKDIQKYTGTNIILIKGKTDEIISKTGIAYNRTGNPGMTKGGTGDVLAGLCAGFLSQGINPFQSAVNSAYLNGDIGDTLLKEKKWYSYLASDITADIAKTITRLKNQAQK